MNYSPHQKHRRTHSTNWKVQDGQRRRWKQHTPAPVPRRGFVAVDHDGTCCVGEDVQRARYGKVQVKYLHPVGGKLNLFNWPSTEDIDDTSIDDIFMPWIYAPFLAGGRHRAKYMLLEGLRDVVNAVCQHRIALACRDLQTDNICKCRSRHGTCFITYVHIYVGVMFFLCELLLERMSFFYEQVTRQRCSLTLLGVVKICSPR